MTGSIKNLCKPTWNFKLREGSFPALVFTPVFRVLLSVLVAVIDCTGLGQTGYMVPFLPLYTLCSILSYYIPLLCSAPIWVSASCFVTWDTDASLTLSQRCSKLPIKYGLASAPDMVDMVDICPGCKSCRHDHFISMNLRHNILAVLHRSPQPISAISATAEKKLGKVDRKNMTSCVLRGAETLQPAACSSRLVCRCWIVG